MKLEIEFDVKRRLTCQYGDVVEYDNGYVTLEGEDIAEYSRTVFNQVMDLLMPPAEHQHESVLTANGHGSFCIHCGETTG